jgi:hypothetical protein
MNKNFAKNEEPKNKNDPGKKNFDLLRMKTEAISKCYDWFEKDRQAKQGYIQEMDEMYKLFRGKHWDLLDDNGKVLRTAAQKKNHPNAVENLTFSLIEGMVAEFADPKDLVDYPQEPGDDEAAKKMSQLKEYIAYKNRLNNEIIRWNRWFFLYGTGVWEKYWDPNWNGGKGPNRWNGEIRWNALHPRSVFPDARCLDNSEDGRRIHKAIYWTLEDVEETWPDAEGIAPDSISDDILVDDDLEFTSAETTEDQVLVVDTWYRGRPMILDDDEKDEGPGLHLIQWAGEGTLKYLSHANYVNYDPGEDTEFPIKLYKCYERERSPWGIGEAYHLKNPQIIANKTAELIIEGHIHEALGQTWYEESAVSEKQKKIIEEKGTLGGMWFSVLNAQGIHREYGRNVPASLENESSRLQKVMETIIGRFDISQGKTPGSVTAFKALDLLASRAQVRLKSKDMTMSTALEDCGNYINRLIVRNYNEKRRYRILGKDDSKPQYGEYDGESMKKAYFFDTDETMPLSDLETLTAGQEELPLEDQLVEGEDYEIYSPEFDTKCKVSSTTPTDRVFYMEMAKELYGGQLIDEETFFYVIEYGKFPPYEDLIKIIQKKKGIQQGNAQQSQQIEQFIQYLKANRPDLLQQIGKLPENQQLQAVMELMKQMGGQQTQAPAQLPAGSNISAVPSTEGPPEAVPPEEVPTEQGSGVPPQADAARIKQELIDIMLAQKEAQSLEG